VNEWHSDEDKIEEKYRAISAREGILGTYFIANLAIVLWGSNFYKLTKKGETICDFS
jgi:hypothetical protein